MQKVKINGLQNIISQIKMTVASVIIKHLAMEASFSAEINENLLQGWMSENRHNHKNYMKSNIELVNHR